MCFRGPRAHGVKRWLISVDGRWHAWTTWSSCSKTCGGGVQQRQRVCEGPFFGGEVCPGESGEQRRCSERRCPGKAARAQKQQHGRVHGKKEENLTPPSASVRRFKEPHEICEEQNTGEVVWRRTPAGDEAATACPDGASGTETSREERASSFCFSFNRLESQNLTSFSRPQV